MAKLLLLVVCISVASALPRAGKSLDDLRASHRNDHGDQEERDDHHGSNEQCVDISQYGVVSYQQESFTLKGYACEKKCETKTEEICTKVEITECDLEGYADCKEELVDTAELNVDNCETIEFVPQVCREDGTQVILSNITNVLIDPTLDPNPNDNSRQP